MFCFVSGQGRVRPLAAVSAFISYLLSLFRIYLKCPLWRRTEAFRLALPSPAGGGGHFMLSQAAPPCVR